MDIQTGQKVLDRTGESIGKVSDIIPNSRTLEQEWLCVKVSLFGTRRIMPFAGVEEMNGEVWVPWDKETIDSAPYPALPGAPSEREAEALCAHFNVVTPTGAETGLAAAATFAVDSSGEATMPEQEQHRSRRASRAHARRRDGPVHVRHRPDGSWAVIKEGAKRASSVHTRRTEAMRRAKELGSEIIVD
jgi:hypothetical protein